MHSSLALHHGTIHTLDPRRPVAEALLVRGETLEAVGTDEEIRRLDPTADRIDLKGRTVLPGFHDSHLHALGYGRFLEVTDLRGCRSPREVTDRLRRTLEEPRGPEAWITGRGWDQERFASGGDPLDRHLLDRLPTPSPVLLERVCGHVGVTNTRGLQILGLLREDPFGPAQVERDEAGTPTGLLREDALEWARGQVYRIDLPMAVRFLTRAGESFARRGLTTVQSDDLGPLGTDLDLLFQALEELRQRDLLPVRLVEQFLLPRRENLEDFLARGCRTGRGDGRFRFGPLKLLLDGSLGARTAALREDYADDPGNRGLLLYEREALGELVDRAHGAGMQVLVHCIGDRSLQAALEAFEAALEKAPRDARHAIVHCQVGDPNLFDRMARLGVGAAIQPPFVASDQTGAPRRLGEARLLGAYPAKSLLDRGILVAGGSDAPVEDPAPLRGLWAAVTRRREPGIPEEGWLPEERLSLPEALDLYTRGGARLSFEESVKGILAPGYYGDLVVLREDPFRVGPEELIHLPVDLTVCGGRITWRHPDL